MTIFWETTEQIVHSDRTRRRQHNCHHQQQPSSSVAATITPAMRDHQHQQPHHHHHLHDNHHHHDYHQTFNIRHTLVGNKIVDHSDLVGASPLGAAPTTSSISTSHLASLDWAKTTASETRNSSVLGVGAAYIRSLAVWSHHQYHQHYSHGHNDDHQHQYVYIYIYMRVCDLRLNIGYAWIQNFEYSCTNWTKCDRFDNLNDKSW